MTEDLLILGELIAEQAAHMDAAEHRLLTNIREFDKRDGWASAQSCAHWLSWRVGWTPVTAREHVRVARALGNLPHIDEALRLGKVSYSKVRAMTRVATLENEQILLMDAELTTGAQLERVCRKYRQLRRLVDGVTPERDDQDRYVTRRDLDNGMVRIEAVLPAEEAALVWAMIDHATKQLHAHDRSAEAPASVPETNETNAHTRTHALALAPEKAPDTSRDAAMATGVSAEAHAGMIVADVSAEAHGAASVASLSAEAHGAASVASLSAEMPALATAIDDSAESRRPLGALANPPVSGSTHTGGSIDARTTQRTHRPDLSRFIELTDDDLTDDLNDDLTDDEVDEPDCTFYDRLGIVPELHTPATRGTFPESADGFDVEDASHGGPALRPVAGSDLRASGRAHVDPTSKAPRFNRADGLVWLARSFATGQAGAPGEAKRSPFEIVVTVGADALQGTASAEAALALIRDGSLVSAETARRLSCDAGIVCMVEDANGTPLDVGRRTRSIPASMKRALFKRDTCCRFPGCTNHLFTDGHHIRHWANGGDTALKNLLRLCGHHHKFVHEYGYRIELDSDGQPRFFDPSGKQVMYAPPRITREDLGLPHIIEANRDLSIQPHQCRWDGERLEYNDIAHALYRLDEGTLMPDDILT